VMVVEGGKYFYTKTEVGVDHARSGSHLSKPCILRKLPPVVFPRKEAELHMYLHGIKSFDFVLSQHY